MKIGKKRTGLLQAGQLTIIVMKMEKITIIKESEVMSHIKLKNDFFKSIIGMNTFNTEMMGNEKISRQETVNTEAFVEDEPVC